MLINNENENKTFGNEAGKAVLLLDSLVIYRGLLSDPVINSLYTLLKYTTECIYGLQLPAKFIGLYAGFMNTLTDMAGSLEIKQKQPDLSQYVVKKIISCDNAFSRLYASPGSCISAFDSAAGIDLDALQFVSTISSDTIKNVIYEVINSCTVKGICNDSDAALLKSIIFRLPSWDTGDVTETATGSETATETGYAYSTLFSGMDGSESWSSQIPLLADYHRINGCGIFACYRAFIWNHSNGDGRFEPVKNPDPVKFSDLIDYENERFELVRNTEQFLMGFQANNVLLYGDRGTGKSSSVKALLNEYHGRGLRMIEVPKNRLSDFPQITSRLTGMNNKFIIFVDDLAFEDNEENYTALKAALEGGLETKPANVLIYATSNRRHLIKEYFSERAGLQYGTNEDEIRASDTIQEKLSLSDRFGLTIVFSSPDKDRYIKIVEELAQRKGISIGHDELVKEAMKWELWYNGRSPRTAQQFTNWLKGL